MSDARRGPRSARLLGTLLLLAVAALVLQGASVPHTHAGIGPGLYNQDHDLTLLATLHGAATLEAAPAAPVIVVLIAAVTLFVAARPRSTARRHADSRAPPSA